ncbi:sigma-70 family RNA polymerase sigma factor [Alkalihalobacillus sp. AL-G]|uniref:sigma-70 family RNA polymerase sigma factor n=1 Tax=Alkalihalobacillus sp. AL-G TaxID=2926399 RepID=UPI00272AD75D|nr:sigma-70 family RNA polymerase sigma factor [Alkalihalobacillus sp. AL-G]WLD92525.1 sigma-70 family RNA polymerase sigma factor [Alkalihalobacillus sp. AL-G]
MDEDIVRKAQKGDEQAFFLIIQLYKNDLYRVAYRYFRNEHDSLEAIQETTFRAYKSIHKVKEPAKVKSWLIQITSNYCLNEIRKRKRLVYSDWIIEQSDEAIGMDVDETLFLESHIFQLKKNLQKVILLKYFQGLTLKEISFTLNKPEGTVKTWLYKALKELRKRMEKEGVVDERA